MNERIDKLFSDAIELTIKDPRDLRGEDWDNECRKKFAELIVKECLEQVWYSREDGINGNISEVIKERIKEHFGVEDV